MEDATLNKDIVVIGDMAKNPRYQGAGSSTINLYRLDNAYNELVNNVIEIFK